MFLGGALCATLRRIHCCAMWHRVGPCRAHCVALCCTMSRYVPRCGAALGSLLRCAAGKSVVRYALCCARCIALCYAKLHIRTFCWVLLRYLCGAFCIVQRWVPLCHCIHRTLCRDVLRCVTLCVAVLGNLLRSLGCAVLRNDALWCGRLCCVALPVLR